MSINLTQIVGKAVMQMTPLSETGAGFRGASMQKSQFFLKLGSETKHRRCS